MKTARKIISNTIYQTIGKLATMGTSIVVTMLVTRRFGPEGYGILSIILLFPTLFFIIGDFGMNAIVAGDIAKEEKDHDKLFSSLLTLRLIFTGILSFLGIIFIWAMPYPLSVKIAGTAIMPTIITFGIYTSTNAIYQAKLSYNRSIISPIARSVAILLLVAFLLDRGVGVEWLVTAYIVGDILLGGISILLAKKFISQIKLSFDKKMYQYIFISALPLGLAAITNPIIGKADTLLLSLFKNETAVGYYSLAYRIFEVCLIVPVFFINAAYPYMVKHYKESHRALSQTSKKLFLALISMGILALSFVWTLAPFMVRILGGTGFESSVLPLRILSLALPVFYLTNLLLWYLITIGKRNPIPFIYWAAVVLNIGANLFVIPRWSFLGAAVVNGVTELFVLLALFSFLCYYRKDEK